MLQQINIHGVPKNVCEILISWGPTLQVILAGTLTGIQGDQGSAAVQAAYIHCSF